MSVTLFWGPPSMKDGRCLSDEIQQPSSPPGRHAKTNRSGRWPLDFDDEVAQKFKAEALPGSCGYGRVTCLGRWATWSSTSGRRPGRE